MKLAIGTITYNDITGLNGLIDSIDYDYVDVHFVIDGRFPNHPGKYNYSVGLELNNDKIYYESLSDYESVKRQRYVDLCSQYSIDALIILDSDEFVDKNNTDWPKFIQEISDTIVDQCGKSYVHNVYSLDNEDYGVIHKRPRLWILPSEMIYVNGSHKIFKNKYHNYDLNKDGRMYEGNRQFSFRFLNSNTFRTKMRRVDHDNYIFGWLIPYEEAIKKNKRK